MCASPQYRAYDLIVARFADVRCALIHGICPQIVIGESMRGYDAKRRKFAMQTTDFIRA